MSLYIDRHKHIEGLTAEAVAEAHQKDLEAQDKHGAKVLKYWFNKEKGEFPGLLATAPYRPDLG